MEPTIETALYVGGAVLAAGALLSIGRSVSQIAPSRQEHADVLEKMRELREDFNKLHTLHREDVDKLDKQHREAIEHINKMAHEELDRINQRQQVFAERQAVVIAELKQIREEMQRFHERFHFFEGPPDKGEN